MLEETPSQTAYTSTSRYTPDHSAYRYIITFIHNKDGYNQ